MPRILATILLLILIVFGSFSQTTKRVPQDYATIQAAIDAAVNGDTVLVAEGTYLVNLKISKKIVLASQYILDKDTSHISRTILDGGSPVVADSASVIFIGVGTDSTTQITGLTIRNGRGTRQLLNEVNWRGGLGVYIAAGAARISHNIIVDNSLTSSEPLFGGGIAVIPTPGPLEYWIIEHNKIIHNHLSTSVSNAYGGVEGGGLRLSLIGRVTHNLIYDNIVSATGGSYAGGGGIYGGSFAGFERQSMPTTNVDIAYNEIRSNSSSFWGGGLGAALGPTGASTVSTRLSNNIISNNTAWVLGSAIHFHAGSHMLMNNTIVDNIGPKAIEVESYRGSLVLRVLNTILWNPIATYEYFSGGGSYSRLAYVQNSCVRNGLAGTGNISGDPHFVSGDTLYHLQNSSPCIGTGAASASVGSVMLYAPANDFFDSVRPRGAGTNPDMGAVENDLPLAVDVTGETETPTVFALDQNYPNPFNPSTTIRFALPHESNVRLTIFNLLGQRVEELVNERLAPGVKQVTWEAKMPTGVYLYRLDVEGVNGERYTETRRMTVLR